MNPSLAASVVLAALGLFLASLFTVYAVLRIAFWLGVPFPDEWEQAFADEGWSR